MIAQDLEVSLHLAFVDARQKRHEFITVEHLLLAMLDNASAANVLRTCHADIEELRQVLSEFINANTPVIPGNGEMDTQPTLGFQRVIQRAILHAQSANKKEISGANILAALFGEKDSHAVHFLNQRNINSLDVINLIVHGTSQDAQTSTATAGAGKSAEPAAVEETALSRYTMDLNAQALAGKIDHLIGRDTEIGRASCRERV